MDQNKQDNKSFIFDAINNSENVIKYNVQPATYPNFKHEIYTVDTPKGERLVRLERETNLKTNKVMMTVYIHENTPVVTTLKSYRGKMEDMYAQDALDIYELLRAKCAKSTAIAQRVNTKGSK